MQFLLNHWHCILPVIGIVVAVFMLRDKSRKNSARNNDTQHEEMKENKSSCELGGK